MNSQRTFATMATPKKQLSRGEIHAVSGKYRLMPGDKPFAEWMAHLNHEEKELEERKFQRLAALGKVKRKLKPTGSNEDRRHH